MNTNETKPESRIQLPNAPRRKRTGALEIMQEDPILKDMPEELAKYVVAPKGKLEDFWHPGREYGCCEVLFCCYSNTVMHLVEDGYIGLAMHGNQPQLLGPGRHSLYSPTRHFIRRVKLVDHPHIEHGSVHIIS